VKNAPKSLNGPSARGFSSVPVLTEPLERFRDRSYAFFKTSPHLYAWVARVVFEWPLLQYRYIRRASSECCRVSKSYLSIKFNSSSACTISSLIAGLCLCRSYECVRKNVYTAFSVVLGRIFTLL
jgi:hypothetical protein